MKKILLGSLAIIVIVFGIFKYKIFLEQNIQKETSNNTRTNIEHMVARLQEKPLDHTYFQDDLEAIERGFERAEAQSIDVSDLRAQLPDLTKKLTIDAIEHKIKYLAGDPIKKNMPSIYTKQEILDDIAAAKKAGIDVSTFETPSIKLTLAK
jgi:hypothetical protein